MAYSKADEIYERLMIECVNIAKVRCRLLLISADISKVSWVSIIVSTDNEYGRTKAAKAEHLHQVLPGVLVRDEGTRINKVCH